MPTKPDDVAATMLKQQFDTALRVLESITEASVKIHEAQLAAAVDAHASAEATRQRLAKAGDAQELWRIQGEWMAASLEKSLAYWRTLYETAMQTQSSVAECLSVQPQLLGARSPALAEASKAGMNMLDAAYKQWLQTTRQFYAPPVVSAPQVRKPA